MRLADNVGHRDLFGTEREHIGDNGALRRLVARLQILRGDLALLDFVVVGRRARLHREAHLVAELLRLIRRLVRQIGNSDLLGALRDVQVDLRSRGFLRSRCGVLVHNAARRDAVVVYGVGGAHLEASLLDDRRGLLKRLALHVGHGVSRCENAGEDERGDSDDGDGCHDGHDEPRLLAALVLGHVRSVGSVIVGLAAVGHGLHRLGHDHRVVGARRAALDGAHHAGLRARESAWHRGARKFHGAARQEVVQREAHVVRGGEAVCGVFLHGLHDDALKARVDVGVEVGGQRRLLVDLLHGDADGVGTVEGELARRGLEEHHAKRVDVACGGELLALRLLGRDVVRRSENGGRLGVHRVLCARDAEVHHLHVAVGLDHDVLRLDVAVDDVLVMGDGKRLAHLRADFGDLALVERTSLHDAGLEVGAADVLHDDEVRAVVLAPVVNVHDVGALQVGGRRGLLAEALRERGVRCVLGQHHLYGNAAPEDVVLSLVHLGHAADPDALGDLVPVVEDSACHRCARHVCSLNFPAVLRFCFVLCRFALAYQIINRLVLPTPFSSHLEP